MAEKKIVVDINLSGKEIKQGGFESLGALPTSNNFAGRKVRLTTNGFVYTRNQANDGWIEDVGAATSQTLTSKTINADNNTLSEIVKANLKQSKITGNLSSSAGADEFAFASVIKAYVDSIVSGLGKFVGDHDASGGLLPTTGSGASNAIEKGDSWRISVAGTITGLSPVETLEVGDILIAKTDGASVVSNFFSLNVNLDSASTTTAGKVELATTAETEAKSDPTRAVTPSGLATFVRKYSANFLIADWTSNAITISAATHGLGANKNLIIEVYEDGTPNIQVEPQKTIADNGDIVITNGGTNFDGNYVIVG